MVRLALVAAVLAWTVYPTIGGPPLNVSFPPQPPADALANIIDDNYLGISYELSSFDTLWGQSVNRQPTAMQNYMSNIAARMSLPLNIRIGGNGMDGSTYVPTQTTIIEHTDPNAYFNDIPVNFGPGFFDILNGMADKVGPMRFTIGLSMRFPEDWTNVTTLGVAAREKLGDRLEALMLGNEPDLYAGHGEKEVYDIETYITEIGWALDALEEAGAITDVPIVGGPTICCGWKLKDILDAGLDKYPQYKFYSVQRYPQHACGGVNAKNTNITYYVTHSNLEDYLNWQRDGILRAQELGIPVIMSEYNNIACGGTNISSIFAMSLWSVDVGLKAATMNYSSIYIHTREFNIQYNLFDPPTPETGTEPGWRTGSPYYGALFLSEITSPGGSVVVDLNLNNSMTSPNATAAAYAIYDNAGTTRGKLALINYAEEPQEFRLPSGIASGLEYRLLEAPSILERTNISWAGQTVGDNGNLEGDQHTIEMNCENGCRLILPGPSAALVVLDDGAKLFKGNSTIASIGGYISAAKMNGPRVEASVVLLAGVIFTFFFY
ncbi:hypothetical protein NLJ89_g1359 [Agrocybe chaxingu]|uniref:Beta-glucuronidase C-terminal domain-containing protein n=1 Tax=Agrocybe chaxingu TaxID=84603 RepID=A0A9W8N084_9AGAR|nr:hypothetical protein NLJ89_g1359 [Agrocybe chaxingu]